MSCFPFPIVDRELRVAARRTATWRMRFLGAAAMTAVWALMMLISTGSVAMVRVGHGLFLSLSILAFGFCLLAGVFLTADSVSEERREGTLGLLFLTELSGWDVVLGKLAATSLNSSYGLLAAIPVLGLPLLMGGVTGGEFWRIFLILLATLFWSLSIGLAVSVFSVEARQAMAGTFLFILLSCGILPMLWWLPKVLHFTPIIEWPLLLPSPAYGLRRAFDSCYQFSDGPREYWACVATIMLTGLASLTLACVKLPGIWRDSAGAEPSAESPGLPARRHLGSRAERQALRETWLDCDPCYWLFARDRSPGRSGIKLVGGCAFFTILLITSCFLAQRPDELFLMAWFGAFGTHQLFKCLVVAEASRHFNRDRQNGLLEMILLTSITESDVVSAQRRALNRHFAGLKNLLLLVNGLFLLLVLTKFEGVSETRMFTIIFVGGAVVLESDFRALAWTGMWMGLRSPRPHQAVLGALGYVMLIPWIGIFLFMFMGMARVSIGSGGAEVLFIGWYAVGFVVATVAGRRASNELHRDFRNLAMQTSTGMTAGLKT